MSQTTSDKGGTAVLQKLSKASVHLPKSGPSDIGSALRRFRNDRCGGVALIAGVSFVPLVMAVGIGIELTHWTTIKTELQRTAHRHSDRGDTGRRIHRQLAWNQFISRQCGHKDHWSRLQPQWRAGIRRDGS